MSLKAERDDTRSEYENQLQELEDNLHALRCEVQLQDLIIGSWIPAEYADAIERLAVWNEEIGDWQIPGLPHTGNNYVKTDAKHREMRKAMGLPTEGGEQEVNKPPVRSCHWLKFCELLPPTIPPFDCTFLCNVVLHRTTCLAWLVLLV